MTRPEGGDGDGGGGEGNAKRSTTEGFDDVWGALVDGAAKDVEAGGTKAWTEDVRAERKKDADVKADEPEPVVGTSETRAWTEEVRAERKKDAPSASASSSALLGPDPEKLRASAEDEMARLMSAPSESQTAAPKVEAVRLEVPSSSASQSGANIVEVRPAVSRREVKAVRPVEEARERSRRIDPPEPITGVHDVVPGSGSHAVWWIVAVAAVMVVGYFVVVRGNDPKPSDREDAEVAVKSAKSEAEHEPPPPAREGALASARKPDVPHPEDPKPTETKAAPAPEPDLAPAPEPDPAPAPDPDPDPDPDPEVKRTGDPRAVPPGTAPANAAIFSKLPIGPGDRPPIGGVGLNGAHVDRIATGSTADKARCGGEMETFSISEHDLVNVCIRVVHGREKEDVIVLWQKDGGTVRRGKIVVPAVHAYRTRAYLMMRKEYVGKWTVRILDLAGTELASHPFVVVE
jgi:hypothetical protein